MRNFFALAVMACALLGWMGLQVGCQKPAENTAASGTSGESHDDHDHDHAEGDGHDHAHDHHELGPNGGHVIALEPGHRHVEWTHPADDEETIQVFVDHPEDVTAVTMSVAVEGAEPKEFALESLADAGPGAYAIKSGELRTAIMMKGAAKVTLAVKAGEQTQTAVVEEHDHDHAH